MIMFPHAKINLGLNVLSKRKDGYHEIDSCLYAFPWNDVLEILPASTFRFKQTGLQMDGLESENLVVKAYEMLKKAYNIPPVYIHLRKNIPMGAGLGGGSSDAASAMVGLNKLFDLKLTDLELSRLSADLGSDCPFFIFNEPQNVSGRGEILNPIHLNLDGYFLKIIHPGIHVSTKEAFKKIRTNTSGVKVAGIISKPIKMWKDHLKNDFEQTVFDAHPELEQIKNKLYAEGAVYASMTGSGSSLYGIFESTPTSSFSQYTEYIVRL